MVLFSLTQVVCGWFSQLEKMNLKGPPTSVTPVISGTEGSCEKLIFTVHVILKRKRSKGNFSCKS